MIILAIETSCDDTAIAVLKAFGKKRLRFQVLSSIVSSQDKIHEKWGGVYPTLAKREHQKNLVPVLKHALKKAGLLKEGKNQVNSQKIKEILNREPELLKKAIKFLKEYKKPNIDKIAVTVGPGLEPCLWIGINFAKALSLNWDLPLLPINHIEAHLYANLIKNKIDFPALFLIASGGHTQLILMKGFGKYKILGETRDDAAGECFDKAARILGLKYPGGPAIEKVAKVSKHFKIDLPRPMIHQKNYDFSFSGLKTAVLYKVKNTEPEVRRSKKFIQEMAYEIQQAIIDVLIKKTIIAAKQYKVKTIILGGGVTANKELRKQIKEKMKKEMPNTSLLMPDKEHCTDNAAMVAVTAYYHWISGKKETKKNIEAKPNLKI